MNIDVKDIIKTLHYYNKDIYLNNTNDVNIKNLTDITENKILNRYEILKNFYLGKHLNLYRDRKKKGVPDNLIITNFCKYLVDLFNGFYCGNGILIEYNGENEEENKAINEDIDNIIEETELIHKLKKLFKYCSIYGKSYVLFFYDEDIDKFNFEIIEPIKMNVFYDNSLKHKIKSAVYVNEYEDENNEIKKEYYYYNSDYIFIYNEEYQLIDRKINIFKEIPVLELKENDEGKAIFEDILSLQDAYNKTFQEYRNDLEQFADQIIKLLGFKNIDAKTVSQMSETFNDNRIIFSPESENVVADYLQKSDNSASRREMLNLLADNIFYMSLCANVSEKNFGQSTGIAMKYKLLAMFFLANNRDEKVKRLIKKIIKILLDEKKIETKNISINIKRDIPNDIVEESQIATQLSNICSKKTILKNISIVDDVDKEIEQKEAEDNKSIVYDNGINKELEEVNNEESEEVNNDKNNENNEGIEDVRNNNKEEI